MWTKFSYPHISLFVLSYLLADLLVAFSIVMARKYKLVDTPHTYKSHTIPTPFLGGVGIYLAFSFTIFSILRFDHQNLQAWYEVFSIVSAGGIVLVLGLVDDYRPINASIKLVILFFVTYTLYSFNITLTLFPDTLLWGIPNFGLTMLWIAGVISAVNSLDNMDGAAAGTATISSLAFFLIAWFTYQRWLSFVSISLVGACLGFLRYNFHFEGAKTFLGDNGAFFLGLALAAMGVLGAWSGLEFAKEHHNIDSLKSFIVPCAVLGVPLYDITLSTILRIWHGKVRTAREAIEFCGQDHIAHRLVALGYSKRQAVLCLYSLGILFGSTAVAIVILNMKPQQYLALTGVGASTLVILGFYLNKAPVYTETNSHNPA